MTIRHKTFVPYEVLKADELNSYVANQAVVKVDTVGELASLPAAVNVAYVATGTGAVGQLYSRGPSGWVLVGPNRIFNPRQWDWGTGVSIANGSYAETGVTAGIGAQSPIVLARPARILMTCQFRVAPTAAAFVTMRMNGTQVGYSGVVRVDETVTITGSVDLAAGTHTPSLRVDPFGGTANWLYFSLAMQEGVAE